MSFKVTAKETKQNYYCVGVPYCDMYDLLRYERVTAHTENAYGWRCDIFTFDHWAICTGYGPIQNIEIDDKIKRELIKKYNDIAKNNDLTREESRKLIYEFINEIRKNIEW